MRKLMLKRAPDGGHGIFNEYGNEQIGYLDHDDLMDYLGEHGKNLARLSDISLSEGSLPVDREVSRKVAQVMRETGLDQKHALLQALRSDPRLSRRYHDAHTSVGT